MPIYEYKCQDCSRKVSVLFRTFSEAETREPACSHCGSGSLTRVVSRFFVQANWGNSLNLPDLSMADDMNENDPKAMQEWMVKLKEQMGQENAKLNAGDLMDAGVDPFGPPTHTMDEVL